MAHDSWVEDISSIVPIVKFIAQSKYNSAIKISSMYANTGDEPAS